MPKISTRQQTIKEIDKLLLLLIITDYEENEEQIQELMELKAHILSYRFFSESERIPKSLHHRTNLLMLPNNQFRQAFRMNKDTFLFILNKIQNHHVFKNNSFNKQQPVWIQLLVVLERLGFDGNSCSIGKVARSLGIGNGTVVLYTNRIIEAILSLHDEMIKWPSNREKRRTSKYYEENHQFKGCIGIVDGTFVNLCQKPTVDPETYWSRKQKYSMNVQIVCNERREIIFYQVGYPGSCNDAYCFRNCDLNKNPERYFSPGEYLLADGGYTLNSRTLTPYKLPTGDQTSFNGKLSSARITVEHVMGLLKGRWSSLRGLRIQIHKKEDTEKVNKWIVTCLVLHNMVVKFNDNWEDTSLENETETETDEENEGSTEESGTELRERIKSAVL
jgi:hypothetical protein